jgi:monoamine oxidase
MEENSVIVIGGGVAGLAAARALALAGLPVTLLEARERLGGRIHTVFKESGKLLVELGAEFIHGAENATWDLLRAAHLPTQVVPERHWRVTRNGLAEDSQFREALEQVMARINPVAPDQDVRSFLDHAWGLEPRVKRLALEYVEGFHAAPVERMSVRALALSESAEEPEKAEQQFRITKGYTALVQWLAMELGARGVETHYGMRAKTLRWERGRVEVEAETRARRHIFRGTRAVVTLPLGVLQEQGPGAFCFEPRLPAKEKAIGGLAMGAVVKVILHFRSRFWPVENFGFLHAFEPWFPTWWTDERATVLTGWAGGPRAARLAEQEPEAIVVEALRSLSRLFKVEEERLRDSLAGSHMYDWMRDPFTRGGYSFTPVGMMDMPKRLAAPVADTLFFAGEATDCEGQQGTVHAALASGKRAAEEILQALRQQGPKRALAA